MDILEKEEELGVSGTQQTGVRLSLLKEGGVTSGDIFEKVSFLVRIKSRVMK